MADLYNNDLLTNIARAALAEMKAREAVEKAANHNASITLLKLPPEIRNRIYDLIIPRGVFITNGLHRFNPVRPLLSVNGANLGKISYTEPAIIRACKLLRVEALIMFYSRQNIRYDHIHTISPTTTFKVWLQNMGEERVKHVGIVEIELPASGGMLNVELYGKALVDYLRRSQGYGGGDECMNLTREDQSALRILENALSKPDKAAK